MPRGYALTPERYMPLIKAMEESGRDWKASEVATFLECHPKNLATRIGTAMENKMLHRYRQGANVFYKLGEDPSPEAKEGEIGDFRPSLWCDGELWMQGLPECNPDGSVTLNAAQRQLLKNLLTGAL